MTTIYSQIRFTIYIIYAYTVYLRGFYACSTSTDIILSCLTNLDMMLNQTNRI
jgi:hypothetical protein